MSSFNRRRSLAGMLLGVGLSLTVGCQTWIGGMTLPSPNYLQDNPDYISQAPSFPLPRELAAMQGGSTTTPSTPVAPTAPR